MEPSLRKKNWTFSSWQWDVYRAYQAECLLCYARKMRFVKKNGITGNRRQVPSLSSVCTHHILHMHSVLRHLLVHVAVEPADHKVAVVLVFHQLVHTALLHPAHALALQHPCDHLLQELLVLTGTDKGIQQAFMSMEDLYRSGLRLYRFEQGGHPHSISGTRGAGCESLDRSSLRLKNPRSNNYWTQKITNYPERII